MKYEIRYNTTKLNNCIREVFMELENHQIQKDLEFIVDKQLEQTKQNLMDSMKEYLEKGQIKIQDCISIDRIEGEIAVSELSNGEMLNIPLDKFKDTIESGDVVNVQLIYQEGSIQKVVIQDKNEEEKARRLEIIRQKTEKIKQKHQNES